MSLNSPIADMLTRIRNASMAHIETVKMDSSRIKVHIVKILKQQGYIKGYITQHHTERETLHVDLKYDENKRPAIQGIKIISKPGRRIYSGYENMPKIRNNYGTLVVSTSLGVMTGGEASVRKVGGELICAVW